MKKILIILILGLILINLSSLVLAEYVYSDEEIDIAIISRYKTIDEQRIEFIIRSDSPIELSVYLQKEGFEDKKTTTLSEFEMHSFWGDFGESNINNRKYQGTLHFMDDPYIGSKGALPNTEYQYEITKKDGSVIKKGNFITNNEIDKSLYPDLELLENYLEIDYLEGDKYKKTREAGSYAEIKYKYKFIKERMASNAKITTRNHATNITLIDRFATHGFWPNQYSENGPFLTKDEFNCFFANGENLITVTIESEEPVEEVNLDNNQFTKTIIMDGIGEAPEQVCHELNNKVFSASISVKWGDDESNDDSESMQFEITKEEYEEEQVEDSETNQDKISRSVSGGNIIKEGINENWLNNLKKKGGWAKVRNGIVQWCEDTDKGLNYYKKGKTTIYNWNFKKYLNVTHEDKCKGSILIEMICSEDPRNDSSIIHKCKYGCNDGKCVRFITYLKYWFINLFKDKEYENKIVELDILFNITLRYSGAKSRWRIKEYDNTSLKLITSSFKSDAPGPCTGCRYDGTSYFKFLPLKKGTTYFSIYTCDALFLCKETTEIKTYKIKIQ